MGRTNYSLNEMLNAVTKRAFNRYTPQTVDYQHLEAATTTPGLVSNRREYSSASILGAQFSLNAQNIVESNYDPFLKILLNDEISEKTIPVLGQTNTDRMSYAISCTDDRKFMAVISKLGNEVKVYEFDESSVQRLSSSGTIDISALDVDINRDGSETFVLKSYGGNIVIDKFNQTLSLVSSTVLFTYSVSVGGYLNVSEDGNRVFTHHGQISRIYDGLVTSSYYAPTISNTSLKWVMSGNGQIVVALYDSPARIETYEIPARSPTGGSVTVQAVGSQNFTLNNFDLSYDGKIMVKGHSNTVIYIWNGVEWNVFQTIVTGLSGSVSVTVSAYAEYFVVAGDVETKVYKLNNVFEQYGNTISGNFGTSEHKISISKTGDTVVLGNSTIDAAYVYSLVHGTTWVLTGQIDGSGKFVKMSNNGDKIMLGADNQLSFKTRGLVNTPAGWSQRGNTISSTGTSLSLSNDGNNLVIGIPGSTQTTIDGIQSLGSSKIYKFSGNLWSQHSQDLLGDVLTDFGKYVSITSNGSKVAIGSDKNSVVRVYNATTPTTITNATSSVVDTLSLIPQSSLLEMSGDGNRLLRNNSTAVVSTTTMLQSLTLVATADGNKYSLNGVTQPTLYLQKGVTFTGIPIFAQEYRDHPLQISATPDGTHGGDNTIIAEAIGVGFDTTLFIPPTSPNILYYFCKRHPNMGGMIRTTQGSSVSVWDKNNSVWTNRDGISEGSAADLSNNGSYLGVEYNNIARSYEIDSDGLMSKIGDDILPSDASSQAGAFRVNTANSAATINVNATNTEILNLASSYGTNVEICSLTWDPTIVSLSPITTQNDVPAPQSSEITGFASPSGFLNPYGNGIMLSRNGQVLVVYDTSKYSVYTVSGNVWTFVRSETLTSSYISSMSISDDGSRIAYSRDSGAACEILVQDTVTATYVGGVTSTSDLRSSTFKSNTILTVCRYNQDVEFYNYNGSQWILDSTKISPGYSSFLVSSACAKWSGDGTILAIGDATAGRVSFYEYGSGWTTHSFIAGGGNTLENFGSVIDLSNDGNTVIVGAPGDGTSAYKGYVKVYDSVATPVSDWSKVGSNISGQYMGDKHGWSVAMSSDGSRVAIGAPEHDNDRGYVRVYDYVGTTWTQIGQDIDGESTGDHSGWDVAMSSDGSRVAIGAYKNQGTGYEAGHVRVWEYSASTWTQIGSDIDAENAGDESGYSVAMSSDGSIVAIGAHTNNGAAGGNSGHVRVWEYSASTWSRIGQDIDGENGSDNSGTSVAISSDGYRVAIGADDNIGAGLSNSGHVRVWEYDGTTWTQIGQDINGESQYTQSGFSVAMSSDGSRVAIGGIGNQSSAGHVRVWEYDGTTWTQIGQDIDGENSSDNSGCSVAITSDGSRVAIGARYHDSVSGLGNGYYGQVRVYDYDGSTSTWLQTGSDMDGESSNGFFGWDVAMSSDGSRVTIGAPKNAGGYVSVYGYTPTSTINSWTPRSTITPSVDVVTTSVDVATTVRQINLGKSVTMSSSGNRIGYIVDEETQVVTTATNYVTTKSQASIRDSVSGSLVNPAYLVDDTTPTELVNVSEDRELEAISMSYDGTRHGIRATTGSYDAIVKQLQPLEYSPQVPTGWTKRGDIITFNTSSSGFGDTMSSSSDGNILAFGYVDSSVAKVRVYGFSDNSWSQLGSDILPSVPNANEISLDLSSDGATLIVLVDPVTGNSIGKAYTYSSTTWSQNGSTIEFRSTGVNKVKISGDGTTLAFGNNTPDSPFPFNIIRVYRKSQDWELISPTMTVAKSPSNYFGGGLSLTNDGSTLATFNDSGVEFSTFSTQTVSQANYLQYLNDITVSGATNDMGDLRLSDSGDRLFVMSGDEKVRVYDSTHTQETIKGDVRSFSITKDGSSMVLTSDTGLTEVFNRTNTSWSTATQITTNMTGGGVTVDIKNDGTSIVLVGSSDSLRLYKFDSGSWSLANSTSGQYGSSIFITDTNDIVLGNNISNGSVKTFEIRDVFQDNSFSAPTLSLNGDVNNRLNFGAPYIELGATVTTNAPNIPRVEISGAVFKDEIGVYSIKYEAEDVLRKTAVPIFRTVEVLPKLATIKLEGASVIYHTQGTSLVDPGVTTSIPVTIYHTTPSDSTSFVPGFPNFVTATTVGEYEIYYTNDTPDKYLRLTTPAKRTVHVRARPVLSLVGASTVYNPLGQEYTDLGVNVTQSGESTTTMLQSLTVVATADGNKYSLNGVTQPTLYLQKGITFTGIQALIQQYGNHPLQISATPDGTHGGDNTIIAATESSFGGTLLIPTSPTSPKTLYYFCAIHPGMGGMIRIVSLNVNDPNVQLSQTQTVTYTTKDEFGIEAIPITRQVIVRKRPTITTSGTLYRIRNDPISIPSPTVDPTNLTGSLQSSNNINITQNGTYAITYNVRDGDGISSNLTRQSYNVGSYGNLALLKTGYVSTLSRDGTTLAVYNTSVQIYKKELDGSWNESGQITTDSTVTSMAFTSDGRHIIIGSSSYLTIGIVRVYKRNDSFQNGWEQLGLEIYGVDYLGYFGHGVDINDDATRIIVSAPEANTNSGTILKAGSLKIFDLQDNFWIQNTQVIEGLSPSEFMGTSVSMSREGDIIAIGSPGYARTTVSGITLTTSNVGKTSVYRYRDNVWGLMGNTIEDGTIDKRNGYSISLSSDGNSIVVGSQSGGGVRVYNFRSDNWKPIGSHISGTFGKSVSLSGNTVVIGSEDENNGRVHIYNLIDGDWSRVGLTFEKIIVAEGGTNNMGKNVNITSDGTLICVTSQNDIRIYTI